MRIIVHFKLCTMLVHSAHVRKRCCSYLSTSHRYRSIIAGLNQATNEMPAISEAICVILWSESMHSVDVQLEVYHYLSASHTYQQISVNLV